MTAGCGCVDVLVDTRGTDLGAEVLPDAQFVRAEEDARRDRPSKQTASYLAPDRLGTAQWLEPRSAHGSDRKTRV
jgi:hypothetical protein